MGGERRRFKLMFCGLVVSIVFFSSFWHFTYVCMPQEMAQQIDTVTG